MNRTLLLISLAILFISGPSFSQSPVNSMDSIISHLEWFNESYYEKISVQLNKEVYRPNDAVWFKANVRGYKKTRSNSETLYVQLLDQNNSLIEIARFKITDGQASGQLFFENLPPNKIYYLLFATQKTKRNAQPLIYPMQVNDFNPESTFDYSIPTFNDPSHVAKGKLSLEDDALRLLYEVIETPTYITLQLNGELIWVEEADKPGLTEIVIPTSELQSGEVAYFISNNTEIVEQGDMHIDLCSTNAQFTIHQEVNDSNQVSLNAQLRGNNNDVNGIFSASIYLKELNPRLSNNPFQSASYISKINFPISKKDSKEEVDPYMVYGKLEVSKKNKPIKVWAVNGPGTSFYDAAVSENGSFIIELEDKDQEFVIGASDAKGNFQKIALKDSVHFFYPLPITETNNPSQNENRFISQNEPEFDLKNYLNNQILPEIVVEAKSVESTEAINKKSYNQTKLFNSFENIKTQEIDPKRLEWAGADDITTIIKGFGGIRVIEPIGSIGPVTAFSTSRGVGSFEGSYNGAWPILFVVNGIRRGFDMNSLNDVLPINIKSIRLIRSNSAALQFGLDGRGGVVIIDTKDVTDIPFIEPEESKLASVSFYTEEIEFTPTGSIESCVYWQPNLEVENEAATISFDKPVLQGTYVLNISGIDEKGCFIDEKIELDPELLK